MSGIKNVIVSELKLKGFKGKKKKKRKLTDNVTSVKKARIQEPQNNQQDGGIPEFHDDGSVVPLDESLLLNEEEEEDDYYTAAEKSFRLAKQKRESQRIDSKLKLTHRQKMEMFNKHLASLSEHFDIPKVGPG